MARTIQYSILPTRIPQLDGYDLGALMVPAQAVGGDFYGTYVLDEEHIALVVGDVSDKGMPATIFMAQSHALLRASTEIDSSPTQVLERVNRLLLEMNSQDLFVTVIYGILHKSTGEFHYVRAAHQQPLILDANGEISLPGIGPAVPLGLYPNLILDEGSITIPRGGCMLLSSDGAADTCNPERIRFGEEGLKDLIRHIGVNKPAQTICQAVFDHLLEYQNGAPQFDDVTLLAVRRLE